MSFSYRKIDPMNDEDIKKYYQMQNELDSFLNRKIKPPTAEQIKWQRIRMGATYLREDWNSDNLFYKKQLETTPDEYAFICENEGELVGYISVCTYHIVDGDRPNDDIGIIDAIYVKDGYRGTDIAYQLLQRGLEVLLNAGKNRCLVTVQEDNPNRFLHYAMADKLLTKEEVTRADGRKTNSYDLLISDLQKLKNMTRLALGKRAAKIKRKLNEEHLEEPLFIQE